MATRRKRSPVRGGSRPTAETQDCFVIMPFGGWFDDYYSSVYCTAIESAGLTPRRADDLYRPSAIVHDIWSYTKRCKVVLADLTGKNPNVFYELGLAHAIAKPAILVTESITDVPFDLRALRVLEYDKNDPAWGDSLRVKITTSLLEVLESPAQAVLPSFLDVNDTQPRIAVTEQQKELLEVRQELELVRRELRRGREFDASPQADVEYLLRRYIRAGMPESEIIEKLSARGFRPSAIVHRLASVRADAIADSSQPPKTPDGRDPSPPSEDSP